MLETIDSKLINDYLLTFGKNIYDKPLFRLVWTSDLREMRTGHYREFQGDLFVRETYGTREVPKYNYLMDRWIIEQWFPGYMLRAAELPTIDSHGEYSVIYVFDDGAGNALALNKRVVEIVMQAKFNLERSKARKLTDSVAKHLAEEEQAVKADEELIGEDSSLLTQLHWNEAILSPGFPVSLPENAEITKTEQKQND